VSKLLAALAVVAVCGCSAPVAYTHGAVPKHDHELHAPRVQQHRHHRTREGMSCADECMPAQCDAAWSLQDQAATGCQVVTEAFCICRPPN